jgi:hypothetical protein
MRFPVTASRWTLPVAALLAVAAIGAVGWVASAGADAPNAPATFAGKGTLALAQTRKLDAPPETSVLVGTEFVPGKGKANGRRARLGGGDEIIAALTGSLVPVAVESTDGSLIAYSSWRQIAHILPDEPGQGLAVGDPIGMPSVRVYDSETGKDRLIENGAHSPALSLDGRLAYVRADDRLLKANTEYTGNVVVGSPRSTRSSSFEVWTTTSARYFPYAWAGGTLLVYKALPDSEATDVYAFTGPGQSRLLAPEAFIVALSPDGSRVLVSVGRRVLEVIRISDGAVLASLELDGDGVAAADAPSTPHFLMYSGSWRGDRVVANSDVGLVVLNVKDGIEIESVLATPQLAHGLVEPVFTDDSHVIGWADLAGSEHPVGKNAEPSWDHALISCDLAAASCTAGDPRPARSWTRWVGNPSR